MSRAGVSDRGFLSFPWVYVVVSRGPTDPVGLPDSYRRVALRTFLRPGCRDRCVSSAFVEGTSAIRSSHTPPCQSQPLQSDGLVGHRPSGQVSDVGFGVVGTPSPPTGSS